MSKARAPWGDPRAASPPITDELLIDQQVDQLISHANSVGQAMLDLNRLVDPLEQILAPDGEPLDATKLRQWIEQVGKRHAAFQKHLAPRGWALSPTLQGTGHYIIIGKGVELEALTLLQADAGLAHWVLEYGDFEAFLNRLASAPLQAVWRWAWIAGDATEAMLRGSAALATYGFLVIAEGMWRDLEEHRTGSRPRSFYAKRKKTRPRRFAKRLVWSEESLMAAHAVLADTIQTVATEPVEAATTNRHGFLHGNVAGIIPIHHAVKAFSIVDAMVELAEEYSKELEPDRLQAAPWIGAEQLGTPPTTYGPLPGMVRASAETS